MENEKIQLTNEQWKTLVYEEYLEDINGNEIEIKIIETNYDGSARHTELHHKIFQRLSDGKYFRIDYESSVKDSMDWAECNYGNTEAVEVFPKEITTTIFVKDKSN